MGINQDGDSALQTGMRKKSISSDEEIGSNLGKNKMSLFFCHSMALPVPNMIRVGTKMLMVLSQGIILNSSSKAHL